MDTTQLNAHLSDTKFSDLDLLPEIQSAIVDAGFEYCTPIQAKTLPISLQGKDIAGQAQTGTGKTAAFLLAAFQHLLKNPKPNKNQRGQTQVRFLILAPTRELAIQIAKDCDQLGKNTALTRLSFTSMTWQTSPSPRAARHGYR